MGYGVQVAVGGTGVGVGVIVGDGVIVGVFVGGGGVSVCKGVSVALTGVVAEIVVSEIATEVGGVVASFCPHAERSAANDNRISVIRTIRL